MHDTRQPQSQPLAVLDLFEKESTVTILKNTIEPHL